MNKILYGIIILGILGIPITEAIEMPHIGDIGMIICDSVLGGVIFGVIIAVSLDIILLIATAPSCFLCCFGDIFLIILTSPLIVLCSILYTFVSHILSLLPPINLPS